MFCPRLPGPRGECGQKSSLHYTFQAMVSDIGLLSLRGRGAFSTSKATRCPDRALSHLPGKSLQVTQGKTKPHGTKHSSTRWCPRRGQEGSREDTATLPRMAPRQWRSQGAALEGSGFGHARTGATRVRQEVPEAPRQAPPLVQRLWGISTTGWPFWDWSGH